MPLRKRLILTLYLSAPEQEFLYFGQKQASFLKKPCGGAPGMV